MGLLKLKSELYQKMHFPVFGKIFLQAMDEVRKFSLLISKSLGCQGLLYLKMWKKSKITAH